MAYFQAHGVALVTGSAGGIGQGAANALAAAGANGIAFADIDEARAYAAAEQSYKYATNPEYKARAYHIDVADAKSVEAVVQAVIRDFREIHFLVNSAGVDVEKYVSVPEDDADDYDRVMAINAKGTLTVSRAVARVMSHQVTRRFTTLHGNRRDLGRGVIVNVTSAASLAGILGKVAYSASKHAALGITRTLALDLAANGIRVNCICPTWVDTPMHEGEKQKFPPVSELARKMLPIGRIAEVDEVGSSVVYLVSPASSYVSGQALVLDAGMSAGPLMAF